jgi:serine/threonine-protein kinase
VHPNVVRYHDINIHQGRVVLVLDFVDGVNLRRVLDEAGGKLEPLRAVGLLLQAAEGVAAVHAQNVIHRDLKPENILVTRDDVAKVTGFGSVKLEGSGVKSPITQRTSSVGYSAPEYISPYGERRVSPKMDVYSLGVILYEAVTGKNPFTPRPTQLTKIVEAHVTYHPPPLLEVMGEGWEDLSFLLVSAMAKEPEKRFDLAEFIEHLRRVQWRLLAPQRAGARSLPLPDRALAVALTERAVPIWQSDWDAGPPPASGVRRAGPKGTIRMSVVGLGQPAREEREAVLPPPSSSAAPTERAIDVRATSSPPTAPMTAMPPPPAVQFAATQPMVDADRRSTGVPVESGVTGPAKGSRAVPVLTVGAILLALGLAAVGWFVFGNPPTPDPRPAATATAPTATASAPLVPSASASLAPTSAPSAPPTASGPTWKRGHWPR